MIDISVVASEYSFTHYVTLMMDEDKIALIDKETKTNVLYAIAIDGKLVYIGKTNNLRTRINYYRTSVFRKSKTTDSLKSKKIHDALQMNHTVEFYCRQCFELEFQGAMVNTMDLEEPILINRFNPLWNKHHKRVYKKKS